MNSARIEFDVPVPMRDGVILRADIYRPTGDGPWPVLVIRTPYGKSASLNTTVLDAYKAVRRGYIVVQQDTRGTGESEGEWLPFAYERTDGYDTIEWAATIEGSSGKIGMFGGSYTGSTQWAAAVMNPPHLAAIAPQITWSTPDNGLYYRGGALEYGLNVWWSLLQSMGQYPKNATSMDELFTKLNTTMQDYDRLAEATYWELPSGAAPALARTGQPDIGTQRGLREPDSIDNPRVAGRYGDVTVPSLNIAGWFDVFSQGTIDNYIGAREAGLTSRLIIGPWDHLSGGTTTPGHVAGINYGLSSLVPGSNESLTSVQLDWNDHYLAGKPAGPEHESGVDIFVMGINQWRHEAQWPLERAVPTPFYLHPDGTLSTTKPAEGESVSNYDYDPADPVPTTGGAIVMASSFSSGQLDQAAVEARNDVLVFTSEPLSEDLEITGRVTASIFAATDGPSTDWVVRLCDVDEQGRSLNVVDGIQRVHTEAGRVDETEVDLWSTSIVIAAGHRLRVHVTSSNFPRWDRNLNNGEAPETATKIRVAQQSVHHDLQRPSHITLPLILS
ncbi:CocE/NonD family hydrolase [Rhodococcus qingshengii]|uniref:CocE/NonD family hydrolase n=1 Tax=Rhodococcus qingshengii TaxID=334542 RepID=UPI0021BB92A5|nr:CocE/NonD family hydrolase [Rhodococcus qingshengii]UXF67260.1 CocE/NonD family hydrolase [Rhodococcus qingshengii]